MMQYKGYIGQVEFDNDLGILHGEVLGMRDVITFEGSTVEEAQTAFRDSVDDYFEFCKEQGEPAEQSHPDSWHGAQPSWSRSES